MLVGNLLHFKIATPFYNWNRKKNGSATLSILKLLNLKNGPDDLKSKYLELERTLCNERDEIVARRSTVERSIFDVFNMKQWTYLGLAKI